MARTAADVDGLPHVPISTFTLGAVTQAER